MNRRLSDLDLLDIRLVYEQNELGEQAHVISGNRSTVRIVDLLDEIIWSRRMDQNREDDRKRKEVREQRSRDEGICPTCGRKLEPKP